MVKSIKKAHNWKIEVLMVVLSVIILLLLYNFCAVITLLKSDNEIREQLNNNCYCDTIYLHDTVYANNDFKDEFREMLYALQIPHADIVYAQAILESGHFTSKNAIAANNYFGMLKNDGSLIEFDHWIESIVYYKNNFSSKYTNKNEDYAEFLHRINYFTDSAYIKKIKQITNDFRRNSSSDA